MGSSEHSIKSAPPRRSARPASHHTHSHDDDGFLPFRLRPINTLLLLPGFKSKSKFKCLYICNASLHAHSQHHGSCTLPTH